MFQCCRNSDFVDFILSRRKTFMKVETDHWLDSIKKIAGLLFLF